MKYSEILKFASIGISARINRQEEANEICKKESGHENKTALKKIEELREKFSTLLDLQYMEETGETR